MEDKWIQRFLQEAKAKSLWSKDISTKVGAVTVGKHNQILSTGFNGFPRGIDDSPERYLNRELKYRFVIHAELNSILSAGFHGVSLEGAKLFIYGLPACSDCAKSIIQSGITDVYMLIPEKISEKWSESFVTTSLMFDEAKVNYKIYFENPS